MQRDAIAAYQTALNWQEIDQEPTKVRNRCWRAVAEHHVVANNAELSGRERFGANTAVQFAMVDAGGRMAVLALHFVKPHGRRLLQIEIALGAHAGEGRGGQEVQIAADSVDAVERGPNISYTVDPGAFSGART